jgi:hypothetical protein
VRLHLSARAHAWIAAASLLCFAAVASALTLPLSITGPTPTAQVGVPYSSALTSPSSSIQLTYGATQETLPPGLSINSATGAITGTPTNAGSYTFIGWVTGSFTISTSGYPVTYPAYGQGVFTITVLPPAVGVPMSRWTLVWIAAGLIGVGICGILAERRRFERKSNS